MNGLLSLNSVKKEESAIDCLQTYVLTAYFSSLDRETGMKGWSLDDMHPDKVRRIEEKVTLEGNIFWLGGGGSCTYYQVDIATNTTPILYSVKLKNKRQKQIVYIGKPLYWLDTKCNITNSQLFPLQNIVYKYQQVTRAAFQALRNVSATFMAVEPFSNGRTCRTISSRPVRTRFVLTGS